MVLVLLRSMPIRIATTMTPANANNTPAIVWNNPARDSRSSMAENAAAGASRMSEVSSGTTEISLTDARGKA